MDEEAKAEEVAQPAERKRPVLKLKAPGTPTWGKICPECGTEVDKERVICHHCGWNFETGKKMRSAAEVWRRKRIVGLVVKIIVWVLLLGAVGVGMLWALGHRNELEQWGGEEIERIRGVIGVGEEKASAPDDSVRERLDRELPMWKVGDEVRLEKTNGSVVAGVLSGLGEMSVTVETPEGMRTVGMGSLSGKSRVRVDGAYREQVIRARQAKH